MNELRAVALCAIAVVGITGCASDVPKDPQVAPAPGWELGRDFSETSSTSGAWTYGWDPTGDGSFVAMTEHLRDPNNPSIALWRPTVAREFPVVARNVTAGVVDVHDSGGVFLFSYGPGMVVLHPANAGERAVVRWSSPVAGAALVDAYAVSVQPGGSTDVAVRQNGVVLTSFAVANSTAAAEATEGRAVQLAVMLQEGDTLDFSVGYGVNTNYSADSTALGVTITQ